MYEYRTLSAEERAELVQWRLEQGYPPHAPPHPIRDQTFYLLTAACYEHKHHMRSPARRQQFLDEVFETFINAGVEIRAWVILSNHYHLLVRVPEFDMLGGLFRLVHGRTSRWWNLEDKIKGRKVWYRYTDRAIRSERHYYVTVNYIHYNPVKHNYVGSPYSWAESSVHWHLEHFGHDWLRNAWTAYPVRGFGEKWDNY